VPVPPRSESGSISRDELKEVLATFSKMGENIPDAEIDALIDQADVDGDGSISMDEVC
jgi:Ca2+-binding EF-hand superfamily protein